MSLFTSLFSSKQVTQPTSTQEFIVLVGHTRYEIKIVGTENFQSTLEAICGSQRSADVHRLESAWLILEPKNRQGIHPVRVEVRERPVGYLSPEHAISYRSQLMRMGASNAIGKCQAMILGKCINADARKMEYEVCLDLPFLCK